MIKQDLEKIKNKKFLIVGLGRSGIATIQALGELGAIITLQDAKEENSVSPEIKEILKKVNVTTFFQNVPENLKEFDVVVLSPGVRPDIDFVQKAKALGAEVIGEMELAYILSTGKFIAITGTNGKTTTTTLVGNIFENSGRKTSIVGNIGYPAVKEVLGKEDGHWFVTEISSFQLETINRFKPVVSAILNLSPDHLDRHGTFENYGDAKAKIFANQDENEYLVLNKDDQECLELLKRNKCNAKVVYFSRKGPVSLGACCKGEKLLVINDKGEEIEVCEKSDIKIIGDHNLENVLAAIAISYFAGIDVGVIAHSIREFGGVEHRIEFCANYNGVDYYNDSKGTNVDASITAIKALKDNIILIAGGDGKNQDFSELAEFFPHHLKALIVFGKDKDQIIGAASKVSFDNIINVTNLEDAVKEASKLGKSGDKVLLSPACASWDMYDNFEQRGQHFKDCVRKLGK